MIIVLSPLNPDPLYKQVYDQVRDAIAVKTLQPETKLPSIREMAKELNISVITIKRAYTDLEKDGYIYTRAGMGSFVADVQTDRLRSEKMNEISERLRIILKNGKKFNISFKDVIELIREEKME